MSKRRKIEMVVGILIVVCFLGIFWMIENGRKKPGKEGAENSQELDVVDMIVDEEGTYDPEKIKEKGKGKPVIVEEMQSEGADSNGIDVSKWQGKIDWKKVKASGMDFAFIRIGYRGENGTIYKDDYADYNIQQAEKADIKLGVYFFSTAKDKKEAIEEANWVKQAIAGYGISYPVVYDCEGFLNSQSRMYGGTAKERTQNALAFLDTISEAGYEGMFYCSRSDAENKEVWDISKIEKKHKIWIAEYTNMVYPEQEKPDYQGKCHAWQYTNEGTINGIKGNVDFVVCYFTKEKAAPKDSSKVIEEAKVPIEKEEKTEEPSEESVPVSEPEEKADIVDGKRFEPVEGEVTAKEYVNLREAPNTNSNILATLHSGEFAVCVAKSDSGWSRLEYNGQIVYAVTSYLSETVVAPTVVEKVYDLEGYKIVDEQVTAKTETNLRSSPSTDSSEVIHTLSNGEYVKRIGIHGNGWSKLEYNGTTVYAISSYLTQ